MSWSRRSPDCWCRSTERSEEGQSVAGQVVLCGCERPPDRGGGGDGGVVGGEALDVERAAVADLVERGHQRRPVRLVATRGSPVAATDLDVREVGARGPDRVRAGALLDVEVVGVEGQSEPVAQQRLEGG